MTARRVLVRGVVQGVGFRPFVYRLARELQLAGWVRNGDAGLEIHLEGRDLDVQAFVEQLPQRAPHAAIVARVEVENTALEGHASFEIRASERDGAPTTRISPDLAACPRCLDEMRDPADRRYGYPYINCTECGPRYSIVLGLPYDRSQTTMSAWPLCEACRREYEDPLDRRFHAQPTACPRCGPAYLLEGAVEMGSGIDPIATAAQLLRRGAIVAVKGLGGYHLACDAKNPASVVALRERKYRKEKPFALMVPNLNTARTLIELDASTEQLMSSVARPIVLAPSRTTLEGVAPDLGELGVMLPSTPLHELLFDRGAPEVLVMTSANRSSEPIAYRDDEARERLREIADAFLVGERPIARRVDDAVARVTPYGPMLLRRGRGYAPAATALLPTDRPIVATGADLKNTVTVVVRGQAFTSQHVGDLEHLGAWEAFLETLEGLTRMYEVDFTEALVAHDAHPAYRSSSHAAALGAERMVAVQHHRAHVAAVLAERESFDTPVIGVAFDGTGYGDDGAIWGGEFFAGSLEGGLERIAHLRYARLAGGDAAARHPVQAAAGFLEQLDVGPSLRNAPYSFPERYDQAVQLLEADVQTYRTTSVGRLFDTAAALLGFTRAVTFEGQAAMWLEGLARATQTADAYPLPFVDGELDFRPLLGALLADRRRGRDVASVARAFHAGLAAGIVEACTSIGAERGLQRIVLSGGVFQNALLVREVGSRAASAGLEVWLPRQVPPNDGGISLGQAALAAMRG